MVLGLKGHKVKKCIFTLLSVRSKLKRNDSKMFKLIENDLGISYKSGMVLGLKGQRSELGLGLHVDLTAIRRGFELYECLLVLLLYDL